MKMKADFITNSSSAAYVVSLRPEEIPEFEDFIAEMNDNPEYSNEGVRVWERFDTKKQLYEFATGRPYDWASKAMAPVIENLCDETYNQCLAAINEGCVAFYTAVDYNACEAFEESEYKDRLESTPL